MVSQCGFNKTVVGGIQRGRKIIMSILIGGLFILIGLIQIYIAYRTFRKIKTSGGKDISPFMPLALYGGLAFGIILVAVGISAAVGSFGPF
jgi:Kef-type K+ transport system membrane component KefB